MIFVPLPFVAALLLLILLAMLLSQSERRVNAPFLLLIGLSALQSLLVGMRWGYDIAAIRYVLPVCAACLPPLVLASFRKLVHRDEPDGTVAVGFWVFPPAMMAGLLFLAPRLIDAALAALFVAYAGALLRLGRLGPDGLDEARLDAAAPAHRAMLVAAASLCLSAAIDLIIFLDFEWTRGRHAAFIAGNANLLGLFCIGVTAAIAARAEVSAEPIPEADLSAATAEQDREMLGRIERLLEERKLFLEEDLTLSRLARRAGVPSRQISRAVNRMTGKNVSQYINDFRVAEACRLLPAKRSVTMAMLEAGFQTKSNFNREFRRVTGLSPAAWRDRNCPSASD